MANEGIRFAQSAIDRFIQFKMIQLQQQREDERNRRFDLSLQQGRREFQERATAVESRFARSEKRLAASTASLIAQRGRPDRGTKEHFASLGYGPETSQRLQDQSAGLTSKPLSPQQMVVIGQAMMNNPLSTEMFNSGRTLLEKGLTVIQGQNPAFPSRPGGIGPDGTTQLETTDPVGSAPQIAFPPSRRNTGADMLGGPITQDFLPPDPDEGLFDRVNQLDAERMEVRHKATGDVFTVPRKELEDLLAEGEYELVEK